MIHALTDMGYVCANRPENIDRTPKRTLRKDFTKAISNARRLNIPEFSETAISNTGKSIHLVFKGEADERFKPATNVEVQLSGELHPSNLKAICEKTGLSFD